MTFTPNQMMDAHRALARLAFSCSPHQVVQEYFDNAIQYNASEILAFLDDDKNLMYFHDNGDGMNIETFRNKYHTLYAEPNENNGISSNGVGSKTFKKFSDIRITLTRDKKTGQMYSSIWDTSSPQSFAAPHIQQLKNEVPSSLLFLKREVNIFLKDNNIGTMIIIPDIQKWPAFSNQSKTISFAKFKTHLIQRLQKRYEYILTTANFNSISVGYTHEGKRHFKKLAANNVMENINPRRVNTKTTRYDSSGRAKIITWEPKAPKDIQQGVMLFRNDIRFDSNEKTYKLSKRKDYAVENSPNKKIRQAVFWDSDADDIMSNINAWKTTAEVGAEIASILAEEYSLLDSKIQKRALDDGGESPKVAKAPTSEKLINDFKLFVENSSQQEIANLLNEFSQTLNKGGNNVAA